MQLARLLVQVRTRPLACKCPWKPAHAPGLGCKPPHARRAAEGQGPPGGICSPSGRPGSSARRTAAAQRARRAAEAGRSHGQQVSRAADRGLAVAEAMAHARPRWANGSPGAAGSHHSFERATGGLVSAGCAGRGLSGPARSRQRPELCLAPTTSATVRRLQVLHAPGRECGPGPGAAGDPSSPLTPCREPRGAVDQHHTGPDGPGS